MKNNIFKKMIENFERLIPMSFTSFLIFIFIVYLFVVVGKSMISNYNSNKALEGEEKKVLALEYEIKDISNEINYYQTQSYKEKEAREKLAYKAPGEKVMSLPLDSQEDDQPNDVELDEVRVRTPNPYLWQQFFFGD